MPRSPRDGVVESPWTPRSVGLLAFTILAWGTNYLFVRVGLDYTDPLWLAALRAATGVACLGVFGLVVRSPRTLSRRERTLALLVGVPNTAGLLGFWFLAAAQVPPGQTAVVVYTYPLWVALLSIPLLSYRLAPVQWGAIAAGFAGIVLVSEPWAAGAGRIPPIPLAELLAAAASWSIATVLVQRRFRPESMVEVNGYQMLGGAVVLFAAALAVEPHVRIPLAPGLWISVAWMGAYGTAFAYAVWFYLLGRIPAATLSAYAFLVPVVALAASAVFLGERLDATQALGVAVVLASIYAIARTARGGRAAGRATSDSSASSPHVTGR